MKKFLGFTLTELMIAITVLGVLTAAVLPAVLGNNPNQNKIMIKKAYYTTAEVISEMVNNETLFARFGDDGFDYVTTEPYGREYTGILNNNDEVVFDDVIISSYKRIEIFSRMINPKVDPIVDGGVPNPQVSTSCNTIASSTNRWRGTTTKDGMAWCFVETNGLLKILVDVNGDRKPNCYERITTGNCVGRTENFDQFRMDVYPDGAIVINPDDAWAKEALTVGSSLSD